MKGAFCISSIGDPTSGGGWNNQQLLKPAGLVPYFLHKNHGFRSVMVGMAYDLDYPYLEHVKGLELNFLPEDTMEARLNYIDRHAQEMDLLILYGAYPCYEELATHYKNSRPDGKIYLATDMNVEWAKRLEREPPSYRRFLKSCDVIGASCLATQKYFSEAFGVNVELIRNGWHNFANVKFDNLFAQKENVILTVGRIGSLQKQNHILLEAFGKIERTLPDWRMRFVGAVEDNFKNYIEEYFDSRPHLRERITFTGLITNKAELMEEYKRAKVFCLTSFWEGCPNAAVEALAAGDFVITSKIDASTDITDNGNCGVAFPVGDVGALARCLKKFCRDKKRIQNEGQRAFEYVRHEFNEEKIVAHLYNLLYGGVANGRGTVA